VTVVDTSDEALKKGQAIITSSLKRVAKKKFDPATVANAEAQQNDYINAILANISHSTSATDACKNTDLVVEAIVENLKVKQSLFRSLDEVAKEHTIFVSNTSSLPIADIAKVTDRRDRFGGLHFFNPVPQMKLVEVVRIPETKQQVYDDLMSFVKAIKKVPVSCKDTPGYVY
jgi:3-hydroxyacyl-CoA dehydrogenase